MESSQVQALIMSQQLANLRLDGWRSESSADHSSTRRGRMATSTGAGSGSATSEQLREELAWEIAMTAQSCVYLAEQLQIFAEKSWGLPSQFPDSTYRLQLDSARTLHSLLLRMLWNYEDSIRDGYVNRLPRLSTVLVREIRSILAVGQAITSDECTINTESPKTNAIEDAGDTK